MTTYYITSDTMRMTEALLQLKETLLEPVGLCTRTLVTNLTFEKILRPIYCCVVHLLGRCQLPRCQLPRCQLPRCQSPPRLVCNVMDNNNPLSLTLCISTLCLSILALIMRPWKSSFRRIRILALQKFRDHDYEWLRSDRPITLQQSMF